MRVLLLSPHGRKSCVFFIDLLSLSQFMVFTFADMAFVSKGKSVLALR